MIDGVLDDLARELENWRAPGSLGREVCLTCFTSPYVALAELDSWPHDAVHRLVRGLQAVAQRQSGALRARHEAELAQEMSEHDVFFSKYEPEPHASFIARLETYDSHATTLVLAQLQLRRRDLDHLLWSSLGERLDSYVGRSLATLLSQLRDQHVPK